MLIKCKYCGKEFEKRDVQQYCCYDCARDYNDKAISIRSKIKKIANKYDFELKNMDKIVNAKMMLFKFDDLTSCPCDAQNPNRFCGSALCIHDTIHKGHCHCNLMHAKKTLQDYENGL